MRTSWLFGSFVTFIIGVILTITIIGAIIGIPLIILSILLLIISFFVPGKKPEIHIHHYKENKK